MMLMVLISFFIQYLFFIVLCSYALRDWPRESVIAGKIPLVYFRADNNMS